MRRHGGSRKGRNLGSVSKLNRVNVRRAAVGMHSRHVCLRLCGGGDEAGGAYWTSCMALGVVPASGVSKAGLVMQVAKLE